MKTIEDLKDKNSAEADALAFFYQGFNTGDLGLLRESWSNSEAAIMSNPLGGILKGWQSIEQLYQRLFSGPLNVHVDFYDIELTQWQGGFLAVGREKGEVQWQDKKVILEIRTSRFFILDDKNKQYRQLHHHGSIESPSMLADYQNLVKLANN